MSEEEKKAIKWFDIERKLVEITNGDNNYFSIILNLIDKLQKGIEFQKEQRKFWRSYYYEEQEKNFALQKENEELKEEVKLHTIMNLKEYSKKDTISVLGKEYISKDKIREVLKDIYFYYGQNNDMFLVDKIRKELLGE